MCPVECFYDAGDMLVIDPNECIDCYNCVPACPVDAIFRDDEVPEADFSFIDRNAAFFQGKTEAELAAFKVEV